MSSYGVSSSAALEKRLRRLEADVQMIATASPATAPSGRSSGDYLGSLVADVAAAAGEYARAALEEQEPVLAAKVLRDAARCDSSRAAASEARGPLGLWWRQLLVERRTGHDCRWYDGSFDGSSLRFSTRHSGTTAQLLLSVSTLPGEQLTWYVLSCDLGGLLPVRDLELAANRLLQEPAGGGLIEFLTAHLWPSMERAGLSQTGRRHHMNPSATANEETPLSILKEAETNASFALAKAKALLHQNSTLPTTLTAATAPAIGIRSASHPSHAILDQFEQDIVGQRRPVPPPASGLHGLRRQHRPTSIQVDSVVRTHSAGGDSSGDADDVVPTTPPPTPQPPTPGSPPPSPANRRPKRSSRPSAVPGARVELPATRSPPSRQPPAPAPGLAPPQVMDDTLHTTLLETFASLRSPGKLCECFKVGSVVGTGQSTVRHAVCRVTGRECAVKYIRKDPNKERAMPMLQELVTECTLMDRLLGQPSILQLAGVFESQSYYEIVTEYCPGGDLFGLLIDRIQASDATRAEGTSASTPALLFTEAEAAATMRQVIQGVAACHSKGIAHRDLKPENVLLRQSQFVLADFGLAADVTSGRPLFQSCGTAEFAAPEVWQSLGSGYNQSCDIWSLGILLYILMCGCPPYSSRALRQQDNTPLRFPHNEWATVSETAIELIRCMLDRDPGRRPTANELLEHPWVCGSLDGMNRAVAPHVVTNLRRWNAKRKLRSCMLALIAGRRMKNLVAGLSVEALIVEIAVKQSLRDVVALCHCFRGATPAQQDSYTQVDKPTFVDVVSSVWQNGRAVSPALAAEHFDAYFSMQSLKLARGRQDRQGDADGDHRQGAEDVQSINWKGFCLALASLLPRVDKESKLKFAFKLFDEDDSGSIDEKEFASMIRCLLVGKCIETASLDVILQAEFEVADSSGDGTIEWQEFVAACDHCPTIVTYFKSLERLAAHTQHRMQDTISKTSPSTEKLLSQPADDANDDSESSNSSEFGSVQHEEPAAVANAMAVAFEAAVVASHEEVERVWQGVDDAAEMVWTL